MPRGRPPIPRSKEEALKVRRSQIRRNVQAFRKRQQQEKDDLEHLEEVDPRKDKRGLQFVHEDLGQWRDQDAANYGSTGRDKLSQPGPELDPFDVSVFHDADLAKTKPQALGLKTPKCAFLSDRAQSAKDQNFHVLPLEVDASKLSRLQFTSNAASTFLPSAQDTHYPAVSSASSTGPHWSQIIPDLVNRNIILDFAIQALCIIQIASVNQERWLIPRSLHFYDKALKALQAALARPVHFQPELFGASNALATYEMFYGGNAHGKGWMYHIEGATRYLNLFPELEVRKFNHQLSFHFLETICVFDALGARRPSCFAKSEWWRESVDRFAGDTYGSLLRMMTSLPPLLEQCDTAMLLLPSEEAYDMWSSILGTITRLEKAYLDWYQGIAEKTTYYHSRQSESSTVGVPASSAKVGTTNPGEPDITFPSIAVARLYLLYWSSMILIYESAIDIFSNIKSYDPLGSTEGFMHALDLVASSQTLAASILSSIRFCLRPSHGIIGKSLVLLPLHIAQNSFRRNGFWPQERECKELLDRLGQKEMKFGLKVKKGL